MSRQIPDEIFKDVKQEVLKHTPSANLEALEHAYHYAAQKHESCPPRMTGEAYICHPLRVGLTLARTGMDTDIVIAAFLHDVLEDCDVTLEELTEVFGPSIAGIVNSVTALRKEATANLTKEERDNQSYKKFLQNLPQAYSAIYVKLADRLDNLQTMENMPDERMLNKLQETEDFYLPLANALGIHLFMSEIKDLLCQLRNPLTSRAIC